MPRSPHPHPTDGELEILRVLWEHGPSPLGDICAALRRQRDVATTTVATMLKVMLDKRLVRRRKGPRGYQWSAAISREATAQSMIGRLVDRLFEGSAQRLVAHLIEEGRLDRQDMHELRRLLAEAERQEKPRLPEDPS